VRPTVNARTSASLVSAPPRLGFVGVGWIGTNRLRAVASTQSAEIVAVADQSPHAAHEALKQISEWAPAVRVQSFTDLLHSQLDGIVIATPNSEHPAQAHAALHAKHAVFCQKPIARTYEEARGIVEAARQHDRLLAVDFCYRHVAGVKKMQSLASAGAIGDVYAAELIFHNAYGPDKPWFYDVRQAGGGCVLDLGIHLIDLLLWVLDYPALERITSRLYHRGKLLHPPLTEPEDYASVELQLATGATARLACSWNLPAGCDAVIEASFYGTRGALRLRNVNGSFYDFRAELCEGTKRHELATPGADWGGVAICDWVRQLSACRQFDSTAERDIEAHRVIDAIYGRCASC
jgi:predicted dehydrogenase